MITIVFAEMMMAYSSQYRAGSDGNGDNVNVKDDREDANDDCWYF